VIFGTDTLSFGYSFVSFMSTSASYLGVNEP